MSATQKKCNMKKGATMKRVQDEKVQDEKSATRKKCNPKRMQHEKRF